MHCVYKLLLGGENEQLHNINSNNLRTWTIFPLSSVFLDLFIWRFEVFIVEVLPFLRQVYSFIVFDTVLNGGVYDLLLSVLLVQRGTGFCNSILSSGTLLKVDCFSNC